MAIAFVKWASYSNSSGNYHLYPAWSGGVPVDGTVIVAFATSLTQGVLTPTAGWNLLAQTDSGSGLRAWAYWKVASSEPTTYTFELVTAAKSWLWVGNYSGVLTTSDPTITAATPNLGGTSHACPSVAVPANGWLLNSGHFRRSFSTAHTYTIDDGSASERFEFSSASASGMDVGGAVYDSNRALTNGAYARTITSSAAESTEVLYSVALSPASTGSISGGTGARWGIHL